MPAFQSCAAGAEQRKENPRRCCRGLSGFEHAMGLNEANCTCRASRRVIGASHGSAPVGRRSGVVALPMERAEGTVTWVAGRC